MTAPERKAAPGRREARKAATRRTVQEHALRLFLEQGYDATTVEQIAAAAGVSHMTFFRHFPSKESVVDTDDYDPMLAGLIRDRPAAEDPLTAICAAVTTGLVTILPADHAALLERLRLIRETPALRARQADNQQSTVTLFADALATRTETPAFALRVLAGAALAALTAALERWADGDGEEDLVAVVEEAFAVLRSGA